MSMNIYIVLGIIIFILLLTYQTWKSYLAIMSFRRNRAAFNNSTPIAKFMGYTMLVEGLVLDVMMNMIVGTLAFYELPKEWLLTSRCSRHLRGHDKLRKHRATWFCHNWLDPYDIGGTHCK